MLRSICISLSFFSFQIALATGVDSTALKYGNTITEEELSEHLHELASDKYEGRETGTKGQKKAAAYIASEYEKLDLPKIGVDESYYQKIPLINQSWDTVSLRMNQTEYTFLEDFYGYARVNENSNILEKEVVFLGFGIDAEKYNDYTNVDVKDKVIVVMHGEPMKRNGKFHLSKSDAPSGWSYNWRLKLMKARENGAKAILIVVEDAAANIKRNKHRINGTSMKLETSEETGPSTNSYYISYEMADRLFAENGHDLGKISRKLNKKGKPISLNLRCDLELNTSKRSEQLDSENLLGFVEGSDLKDEIVVLTAHYDHIGIGEDEIYNGADDDGSGTVALLEIAEAFALAKKEGHGPRRSILILPVSAEEKGLLGSRYYTQNPVFPLENTVANLNMDMIGRIDKAHEGDPNYVYIIGSNMLSNDLHDINEQANSTYTQLALDYKFNDKKDPNRFYYRSDHYNFAKHNIPIIFYFNGVHEDYHKPTDTVDKIHFGKLSKITKLVFYTAWELANREDRIELNDKDVEKVEE